MRYVFKTIEFIVSVVFLALCIKAFCVHFYQDIEEQLHARTRKLPIIKENTLASSFGQSGYYGLLQHRHIPTYQLANLKVPLEQDRC
jgi:hypothetical protein